MDLAVKILAAVIYVFYCVITILQLSKKVNVVNVDSYATLSFVILFLPLAKLNISISTLLLLLGAVLLIRLAFIVNRVVRNRSSYELSNVNSQIKGEIYGLVDAFNRTLTAEKASAIFTNKRPYRIEFRGVPRKDAQKLLGSVNLYIRAHSKTSPWIILELLILLALGALLVLWFKNVCLLGIL